MEKTKISVEAQDVVWVVFFLMLIKIVIVKWGGKDYAKPHKLPHTLSTKDIF